MNEAFDKLVADAPYGVAERLSPLVRRVLAHNPSPFTFTGTGTYIVGNGTVAIVDPGPADEAHLDAVARAVAGETVSHHVITHTHMDHSPGAAPLKARLGGLIVGCAPLTLSDDGPRADAGFDPAYAPDAVLADGEAIGGPGWTLRALHTPGHTSNHLCYALEEEAVLFTGDHVMGWSTTIVSPPDGDMADYMRSLDLLVKRDDMTYFPAHGPPIEKPQRHVRAMITHRRMREQQILRQLGKGDGHIPAMVEAMYQGTDPRLFPAAGRSVLAHLVDLEARGMVRSEGAIWRLAA